MSIIVPSSHTRIRAWVNSKMQGGKNSLVYCTISLIAISDKHRIHGSFGLKLSLLH